MATDMPATTMVRSLAPSHTIRRGASADFGRLFSTTRHGSRIRAIRREHQRSTAVPTPRITTKKKLIRVSASVTAISADQLWPRVFLRTR